jgi:precorrin-6x reductase
VKEEQTQYARHRYGALNVLDLIALIKKNKVTKIIDAAHPFAENLHQTIAEVADTMQIPVICLTREKLELPKNKLIHYVENYNQVNELLQNRFSNKILWALTGVQSIEKLKDWWKDHLTWFRILPREESIQMAASFNFPKDQLVLEFPTDNEVYEISLVKDKNIGVILTKETGTSGFLMTKIKTAIVCNVPIIIIQKPKIPNSFKVVYEVEELEHLMRSL